MHYLRITVFTSSLKRWRHVENIILTSSLLQRSKFQVPLGPRDKKVSAVPPRNLKTLITFPPNSLWPPISSCPPSSLWELCVSSNGMWRMFEGSAVWERDRVEVLRLQGPWETGWCPAYKPPSAFFPPHSSLSLSACSLCFLLASSDTRSNSSSPFLHPPQSFMASPPPLSLRCFCYCRSAMECFWQPQSSTFPCWVIVGGIGQAEGHSQGSELGSFLKSLFPVLKGFF